MRAALVLIVLLAACTEDPGVAVDPDINVYFRCETMSGDTFVMSRGVRYAAVSHVYDIRGDLYAVAQIRRCTLTKYEPGQEIK